MRELLEKVEWNRAIEMGVQLRLWNLLQELELGGRKTCKCLCSRSMDGMCHLDRQLLDKDQKRPFVFA